MFLNKQDKTQIAYYQNMLKIVGSLSRLYSESKEPYLHYRIAENLFCKSFNAENLSRSDTSADASLNGVGFGIKTFGEKKGQTMEKIAEFNKQSASLKNIDDFLSFAKEVGRLRNERIKTTQNIYDLNEMMYHCITRTENKMHIFESPMHFIDIDNIEITKADDKSIYFFDGKEEYSFNFSKSTLYKRFILNDFLTELNISILEDPFDFLENIADKNKSVNNLVFSQIENELPHIYLPLYSTRDGEVPEKSGLNQWNANGRERQMNEVYIPIPAWIHKVFPDFFPAEDIPFDLKLPNKKTINARVCQQGRKALMSNPNTALGEWILRDVLNLKEGELLTYEKLEDIGLDSIILYKLPDGNYKIDFAKIDSFQDFEKENKTAPNAENTA
jgi:hypothetical protein